MNSAPNEELIPTRQSLLSRLRVWDDREAWQSFFDTYWHLIYRIAIQAGLTESEAEEVVQETIVTVAKQMPSFRYNPSGSFKAWLLRITRWRIVDQLRRRPPWTQASESRDGADAVTEPGSEFEAEAVVPEAVWDENWSRNRLEVALQRVKARVRPRQYQIFDLYVVRERPVREVMRTLNVSAAQVYLARHRVARLVREQVRQIEERFECPGGASCPGVPCTGIL